MRRCYASDDGDQRLIDARSGPTAPWASQMPGRPAAEPTCPEWTRSPARRPDDDPGYRVMAGQLEPERRASTHRDRHVDQTHFGSTDEWLRWLSHGSVESTADRLARERWLDKVMPLPSGTR